MSRQVFFVGPMKAGTTWIHEYLASRGDVILPVEIKETFYFDRFYEKGINWYFSHFPERESQFPLMEVAPSYFANDLTPSRIKSQFENVVIVITLRDPVKRSWSHYLHLRRYGYTNKDLVSAIVDFPQIIEASLYSKHLARWISEFGEDSIQVFWQEDLFSDSNQFISRLCRVLDLPYIPAPIELLTKRNEAAVPRSYFLSKTVRSLTYLARSKRWGFLLSLGKKLRLKEFVYGRPGEKALPDFTAEDRKYLSDMIITDYQELPGFVKTHKGEES